MVTWLAIKGQIISFKLMDYSFIWSIIHIYVPTINAEDEWLMGFITTFNLKSTEDSRKNVIFVVGYWNAKVGNFKKENVVGLCTPGN